MCITLSSDARWRQNQLDQILGTASAAIHGNIFQLCLFLFQSLLRFEDWGDSIKADMIFSFDNLDSAKQAAKEVYSVLRHAERRSLCNVLCTPTMVHYIFCVLQCGSKFSRQSRRIQSIS